MIQKVKATIARYSMIHPGERAGVAVSGGVDSVVLLDILRQIVPCLQVVHVNHRLRGAASDADEQFVRVLAASWNLSFHSTGVDLSEGNTEQAGRDARRAFFAQLRAARIVDRIATGHTRSDQAETVLYRLLRGSGTAGLSGILPVTAEGIIRPLLDCTRAEVLEWAQRRRLIWRDDHTNSEDIYVRNRLRRRLLPAIMQDFSPAAPEILAATATIARDEEDYWRSETNRVAAEHLVRKGGAVLLRADRLLTLHPAVARRLLRRAIAEAKGNLRGIDLTHVEALLALAAGREGHGRFQAPGIDVFRSFEWLRIAQPRALSRFALDYAVPVTRSLRYQIPQSTASILLEIEPEDTRRHYTGERDEADWDRLRFPVELRNWHPGDEFQPPGRSRRKIKVLFQEARVPIWERHRWPVLTSAGETVWTRGFGVAEPFLPDAGTRTLLRVYEIECDSSLPAGTSAVSCESDEAV